MERKTCRRCGETKPIESMKRDLRNGDGYSSFCKACHGAATVAWQNANRDRMNEVRRKRYTQKRAEINAKRKANYDPEAMRWERRLSLYKVTREWYERTLDAQGGGCAICGARQEPGKRSMPVDHDHKCFATTPTCGKCNRGILCHKCNTSLHAVEFAENWIYKAVNFLNKKEGNR